jgi:hypothetical protein
MTPREWIFSHRCNWMAVYVFCRNAQSESHSDPYDICMLSLFYQLANYNFFTQHVVIYLVDPARIIASKWANPMFRLLWRWCPRRVPILVLHTVLGRPISKGVRVGDDTCLSSSSMPTIERERMTCSAPTEVARTSPETGTTRLAVASRAKVRNKY